MSEPTPLQRVCGAAAEFYADGSKSMLQLLREAELDDLCVLTTASVKEIFAVHPKFAESWLRWSLDKRVSSGWYISQKPGCFVVGFFPGGPSNVHHDFAAACSEFVVREITDIYERHAL